MNVTSEDIIESLTDKKFLVKLITIVILALCFTAIGYYLAKEDGMREGNNFGIRIVKEYCGEDFVNDNHKKLVNYEVTNYNKTKAPMIGVLY